MDILKRAKIVYKKFIQSDKDIDLCEKYVYGRGKDSDQRFFDVRVEVNNIQYIKSRLLNYTEQYKKFISDSIKKLFTINKNNREKEFLAGQNHNLIAIEKELIGTISRDKFFVNVEIESCKEVDFAADVNSDTNIFKNKKYIRIFENIPEECDSIVFYCYGLNDSAYSLSIKDIYDYNCIQKQEGLNKKPFGIIYFNYTGVCMSGNITEAGDDSFVNDAILLLKYIVKKFPKKEIIIMSSCFGVNVASRAIADLNLDCISRNLSFKDIYNISNIFYCVPYISAEKIKKDQRFITRLILFFVSKNYRYGHRSKFSITEIVEFIPKYINISILQARNPIIKNRDDFLVKIVPVKIKNLFTRKDSDNFVPFEQTYQIANVFLKNGNNVFFYYSKKLDHDRIIFFFWTERLDILRYLMENKMHDKKNLFTVSDIKVLTLIRINLNILMSLKESLEDNLYKDIENILNKLITPLNAQLTAPSVDGILIVRNTLRQLIDRLSDGQSIQIQNIQNNESLNIMKINLTRLKHLLKTNEHLDLEIQKNILTESISEL